MEFLFLCELFRDDLTDFSLGLESPCSWDQPWTLGPFVPPSCMLGLQGMEKDCLRSFIVGSYIITSFPPSFFSHQMFSFMVPCSFFQTNSLFSLIVTTYLCVVFLYTSCWVCMSLACILNSKDRNFSILF